MCPKGYVNMEMSIIIYYAVRVNKLVPCLVYTSGALEIWRIGLRIGFES